MAGKGPAPKMRRRNPSDKPTRGDWRPSPGTGWQHGRTPAPPPGLLAKSQKTWKTWMCAWFAAYWDPGDLPGLHLLIGYYDQIERGDARTSLAAELRLLMDSYGITKKGQQDRRWTRPEPAPRRRAPSPYAHIRLIDPPDTGA